MNTIPKVTMRLKLNDAATEDNIVKAIDEIENRAKNAETLLADYKLEVEAQNKKSAKEAEDLKAKLKKAEEDLENAKKEYEDCKSALDAMEADKKKAEEDAKKGEAKNMIVGFAKAGRIKDEETVILEWVNTALALGIEKTKNMIEALPLNKVAPVMEVENKQDIPSTAEYYMAKNRLKREGKTI